MAMFNPACQHADMLVYKKLARASKGNRSYDTYVWIESVAELVDAARNLVKMDRFALAVALDNVVSHGHNNSLRRMG
jgi:hypothetical protein